MPKTKKVTHGGKRKGAGRPGPTIKNTCIHAWVPQPVYETLKQEAETKGIPLITLVTEAVKKARPHLPW